MEVTELSGKRFELAIELFQNRKDNLLYQGVLFINNGDTLEINSYSDFMLENTTEAMAHDKIEESKQILSQLTEHSKVFGNIVTGLPKEYIFCYNYHTGAVAIASETQGIFTWLINA